MNAIRLWDPFRELDEFSSRFNRLLGNIPSRQNAEWAPAVDILEDNKEYLLKAEVPEVEKGDVKVTVENGMLSITGERKSEKEENDRKFHRMERAYGRFVRTFSIPDDADGEKVSAEFHNGVLLVHLPKFEKAKPREIEVKIEG